MILKLRIRVIAELLANSLDEAGIASEQNFDDAHNDYRLVIQEKDE